MDCSTSIQYNEKDVYFDEHAHVQLSIVVPLYNEEASVKNLVSKIHESVKQLNTSYELILVDDGSTDSTWKIIQEIVEMYPQLRAIKLRRNFGQTSAMTAGFEYASGDVIVTLDGDLQNDPNDIPALLTLLEEGYDIVSGWRKHRRDNFLRVQLSRAANYMISATTGVRLHDYGCTLKAYKANCVKPLKAYGEMHRFLPALASMTGARITELPVNHHPRKFGKSKYGFNRIFKVFSDIFSMNLIIRFSSKPLTGFTLCATPFFLLTLLFGLLGIMALTLGWTAGKGLFFFVASGLSAVAMVHLVVLGVLGELAVGTSDLTHTSLPEITKKEIQMKSE